MGKAAPVPICDFTEDQCHLLGNETFRNQQAGSARPGDSAPADALGWPRTGRSPEDAPALFVLLPQLALGCSCVLPGCVQM